MKTVRKFSLSAVAALALGACSKDTTEEINLIPEGEKVKTAIEFTVPTMETPVLELAESSDGSIEIKQLPETRFNGTTAENSEKAIKNLCVLQFSADGTKRLAYDYIEVNGTGAETSVTKDCEIQAAAANGSKVYFVANVGNTLNSINTETEFQNAFVDVGTAKWDIASKGIPMCSAAYTGAVAYGTAINVTLTRMFAAVKFTLSSNAAFTGATIKMYNVAKKAYFVSKAASTTASDFFDYTENFTSGQTWYIPENKQADVTGCATSDRGPSTNGGKAPAYATYFDIAGTYTKDGLAYGATYRVYLGKNNTTSFSVERNNAYTVTAQVAGMNAADKRVIALSRNLSVKYGTTTAATANCYIVNRAGVTYSFDGTKQGNSSTSVGSPTRAVLVWEDVKDLIKNVSYANGKVSFKVTTASSGQTPEGNAVIAVTNTSGQVLWSWHIWSTAYNPYTSYDTYYTNSSSSSTTQTLKRPVQVMQRNLGAANNTPGSYKSFGLLYQWGRKDPFVGANTTSGSTYVTTYDASGNSRGQNWGSSVSSLPAATTGATTAIGIYTDNITVAQSIQYPMIFVATGDDWLNDYDDTLWGEPTSKGKVSKSKYDPCPDGWNVPARDTWTAFTTGVDDGGSPNALAFADAGRKFYYDGRSTSTGGPVYYPASGYRDYDSGQLGGVGSYGNYWSAAPYSPGDSDAGQLYFDSDGNVIPLSIDYRAFGCSVRCARE